jgi:L-threonylcarbamoyladenylate synthase
MSAELRDLTVPADRAEIVRALHGGEVVVLPTRGLFGFSALPDRKAALRTLRSLKGEDAGRPGYILLASDLEMVEATTGRLPGPVRSFLLGTWPAQLSVVLPRAAGGPDRVAFRVPPHEPLLALLREIGRPIISTSVNRHGRPPLFDPEEIAAAFFPPLRILGHGGPEPSGAPSTLVDLTGERPRLLRAGAFPWREGRHLEE